MRTATSNVFTLTRKDLLTAFVLLSLVAVSAERVEAQFLCSAGSRDGQDCAGDIDCPDGGVCVIPLGVCNGGETDGFPCPCPSSECAAEPVCPEDRSIGTCADGIFSEVCCDLAENCFDGAPCASTQKLCTGPPFQGFPCLDNADCEGASCASTGRFCLGGDADSFACVDDSDCPGGDCVGAVATPTGVPPTATSPAATATPRPTNTSVTPPTVGTPATPVTPATATIPVPTVTGTRATAVVTATRTPSPSRTPGITPISTATAAPTNTPAHTRTPSVGMFATTTSNAPAGSFELQLDVASNQLASYPVEGIVQVFGETFGFTRRRTSQILNLTDADGLPFDIAAGTVVLVVEATPRPTGPGGVIIQNKQGGSCAILPAPSGQGGSCFGLFLGAALLFGARRRR